MKSRRHAAAFTMVELMVAIAIAVIVTWGLYDLYTNYVKAFIAQDRVIETQQTARIAIDTLTQDLLRAGYKVSASQPAIVSAASNDITVELYNDQANAYERIRYVVDGSNNLLREVYRNTGGWVLQDGTGGTPSLSGPLADNIRFQDLNGNGTRDAGEAAALEFTYFTQTAIQTNPTSPTPLDVTTPVTAAATLLDIRQVRVSLTARSAQRDPVTGRFVYRTLRADVKPRNAGLMSTIKDNNPPAVPTGLLSVDRGDCGYLYVSWNENTEPDLAGYTLYYGTAPGIYLSSVNIGKGLLHSIPAPYALSGLANGTQYYLAIAAYDYSGNSSALSSEVYTGLGANDTTPNVANPDSAPVNFVGVAGANQVTLSWDKLNEPDIAGYRVYRKTSAFTGTDYSAIRSNALDGAGIRQVADETMFGPIPAPGVTVTATGYSFRDTLDLKGCVDQYYAVTAIKGCSQPVTSYPDTLFSTAGPKTPTDSTPPDPATLVARPSYLRNYLTLTNPSGPTNIDFTHSLVAYSTGPAGVPSYPTFSLNPSTGAITTTGTLVECYSSTYGPGSFTGPGTPPGGILHKGVNGTCAATYSLNPSVTYYYTAVAIDTCKNLSNYAQANSQVAATQCGDETEGLGIGNPPKVLGVHGNTKRSAGGVTTSDATLAWIPIPDAFDQVRDFAGYYVARKSGDTTSTTPFPVLNDIWTDPTAPGLLLSPSAVYSGLTEGRIDRVRILGVDCETVTKDDAAHAFLIGRYPTAEFDLKASDTLIFYPGTLTLATAVPTKALGRTLNVVEFQTQTTINAAATPTATDKVEFKSLTFDWTTPNGGLGSDRLLKSVTINNGATTLKKTLLTPLGSPATINAVADTGERMGFRGATNAIFQLEFFNSTTGTASKASMGKLRIDATAVYVPVTRLNSDAAPPFVFDATQEATVNFSVPATRGPDIGTVGQREAGTTTSFTPATTTAGLVSFPYNAIEVSATITDNSGKGVDRVQLYYAVTSKLTVAAPSIGTGFPTTIGASYVPVTFCDSDAVTAAPACSTSSSFVSTVQIPAQNDQRVWFFVLVYDKSGNYSVSPPQDTIDSNLTYTYDQAASVSGPL